MLYFVLNTNAHDLFTWLKPDLNGRFNYNGEIISPNWDMLVESLKINFLTFIDNVDIFFPLCPKCPKIVNIGQACKIGTKEYQKHQYS